MRSVVTVVVSAFLAGCLVDPKPTDSNTAPVLVPIGDRVAVAMSELVVTLEGSDAEDGSNLQFKTDGTVGPHLNPYMQPAPAVWDASNRRMTWTPTSAEAGKSYSVQFTVTDRSSSPQSDSETIKVDVFATAVEGGSTLFSRNCSGCHGADATGTGSVPDIRGKTADEIRGALNGVLQMQSLKSKLTDANIIWLAEFLASLSP